MQTSGLPSALSSAISSLSKISGEVASVPLSESSSLGELEQATETLGLVLDQVLAGAALNLAKARLGLPDRNKRDSLGFLISDLRKTGELLYTAKSSVQWSLSPDLMHRAVLAANLTMEIVHDLSIANSVPIFEILGLRNLSSLVGEIFAREIQVLEVGKFISNPNQDGYPDLCARTPEGDAYIELRMQRGETSAKEFWSPFPYGGVEVKGTCGNTPPAKKVAKPKIGDSRYPILYSAEWKAHHRQTNNLAAIYWDFLDGLPTILAVFFRNDLVESDWGEIIQPKVGGGKTTSVSIMTRGGVEKMAQGWVVLPDDTELLQRLLQSRVFPISEKILESNCSAYKKRK
jgi:hypothetical protein